MEELKHCTAKTITVDGYRFTRDERRGYYRCHALRKRLHQYIWEREYGKVPEGFHVHHIDEDKKNNHISNLQVMNGKEHVTYHGNNLTEEEIEWRRNNLAENVRPKASEWHGSEEGRAWHKEHYEEVKDKLHARETKECWQCGKLFEGRTQSRFCANKCKSKWRREQGLDDVEKQCVECGQTYVSNKYHKQQTCSPYCRNKLAWKKRKAKASSN